MFHRFRAPLPGRSQPHVGHETRNVFGVMQRLLDGMSVLVVDDEPDALDIFATSLTRLGAIVRSATSVPSAIEILQAWKPDAILCDLHIPGEDGYSLLEYVRAHDKLRDVPLIAISGSHPTLEREKSLSAGFAEHLCKPTRLMDIVAAVSSVVMPEPPSPPPVAA